MPSTPPPATDLKCRVSIALDCFNYVALTRSRLGAEEGISSVRPPFLDMVSAAVDRLSQYEGAPSVSEMHEAMCLQYTETKSGRRFYITALQYCHDNNCTPDEVIHDATTDKVRDAIIVFHSGRLLGQRMASSEKIDAALAVFKRIVACRDPGVIGTHGSAWHLAEIDNYASAHAIPIAGLRDQLCIKRADLKWAAYYRALEFCVNRGVVGEDVMRFSTTGNDDNAKILEYASTLASFEHTKKNIGDVVSSLYSSDNVEKKCAAETIARTVAIITNTPKISDLLCNIEERAREWKSRPSLRPAKTTDNKKMRMTPVGDMTE